MAVWLALMFAAQVKPVLQEELFQWDVTLVQAVDPEATPAQAEPVTQPAQPIRRETPATVAQSIPEPVTYSVAPQQSARVVHPATEPAKPIEQKVELPEPKPAPVEQKIEPPQPKVEPIQQNVAEPVQPNEKPVVEAREPEPVKHAEPMVAVTQPLAVPTPEAAEPRRVPEQQQTHVAVAPSLPEPLTHTPPITTDPPVAKTNASEPARTTAESPHVPDSTASVASAPESSLAAESSTQVAKAAPQTTDIKADHRWLAESLWRRVAELKRYPTSARLHGLEGKVVLKAVIRSDGHLAEVSVQKSSGHTVLDEAAMEAVKLACPLQMKRQLGTPQIVVSLPIVYSLAN